MKVAPYTEEFETADSLAITVERGKDYAERDGKRVFVNREYTMTLTLPPGFSYMANPPVDMCLHEGKLYLYFKTTREKEPGE